MRDLATFSLLSMSTQVCIHCEHWKAKECAKYDYAVTNGWSYLTTCNAYKPNERAGLALQELTMRKLEGNDIEYHSDDDVVADDVADRSGYTRIGN